MIVAAHRQQTPVDGRDAWPRRAPTPVAYDPDLLPLPGEHPRLGQRQRALHEHVRVRQRSPVRRPGRAPRHRRRRRPFYRASPAAGVARVVCFSPRHDLTLAEMPPAAIAERGRRLARAVRASWARAPKSARCSASRTRARSSACPTRTRTARSTRRSSSSRRSRSSTARRQRHLRDTGRGLMADIIRAEQRDGRRVLHEDEHVDRVRALLRPLCRTRSTSPRSGASRTSPT